MNAVVSALIKVAFSIFLLAIAFWPEYGLAYYIVQNFTAMPAVWVVVIAIWIGALALNLPISLNLFRQITTGSIVAMFGAAIWTLFQQGWFDAANWQTWMITGIIMLGTIIGWWTVSVPLWRWWRKTLATEENTDIGGGDSEA